VLVGGVVWWRKRRKPMPTIPGYLVPEPWDHWANEFEQSMARRGLLLRAQIPWNETVANLPAEDPVRAPALRFIEIYIAGRFGGASNLTQLKEALEAVRTAPRIDSKGNGTVPSPR